MTSKNVVFVLVSLYSLSQIYYIAPVSSPQFVFLNNAPIGELAFCFTCQIYARQAENRLYFKHILVHLLVAISISFPGSAQKGVCL